MPIESAINCAAANPEIPHFDVVGIDVAAIDVPAACKIIAGVALTHVPAYVTVTGAHGIVESVYDESVRHAHQQAMMVVPDGMECRLYGWDASWAAALSGAYTALT